MGPPCLFVFAPPAEVLSGEIPQSNNAYTSPRTLCTRSRSFPCDFPFSRTIPVHRDTKKEGQDRLRPPGQRSVWLCPTLTMGREGSLSPRIAGPVTPPTPQPCTFKVFGPTSLLGYWARGVAEAWFGGAGGAGESGEDSPASTRRFGSGGRIGPEGKKDSCGAPVV